MKYARFYFFVDNTHFPGYKIIKPIYLDVEYEFTKKGSFSKVLNVVVDFKFIGQITLSQTLANQIEEAARQHLNQTFEKNENDLKQVL